MFFFWIAKIFCKKMHFFVNLCIFNIEEHSSSAHERLNVSDVLPVVKVSRKQCFKFLAARARLFVQWVGFFRPPIWQMVSLSLLYFIRTLFWFFQNPLQRYCFFLIYASKTSYYSKKMHSKRLILQISPTPAIIFCIFYHSKLHKPRILIPA